MTFSNEDRSDRTTGIDLRVEDPLYFRLLKPFTYTTPDSWKPPTWLVLPGEDGDGEGPPNPVRVEVPAGKAPPSPDGRTDLASVPSPLWGLVASYGPHTEAALLHDYLCDVAKRARKGKGPASWERRRRTADELFWVALRDPGTGSFQVPPVRSTLLWAGVSAGRLAGTGTGWIALIGLVSCVVSTWCLAWIWRTHAAPPASPPVLWLIVCAVVAAGLGVGHAVAVAHFTKSRAHREEIPWWLGWLPALAGLTAVFAGWLAASYALFALTIAGGVLAGFLVWVNLRCRTWATDSDGWGPNVVRTVALLALFVLTAHLCAWLLPRASGADTPAPPTWLPWFVAVSWLLAWLVIAAKTKWSRDLWLPVIAVIGAPVIVPVLVVTAAAAVLVWLPDVILGDTGRPPIAIRNRESPERAMLQPS